MDAVEGLLPSFDPGHQRGAIVGVTGASWDQDS